MSLSVSTERTVIQCGSACCQTAIHELQAASSSLLNAYSSVGSGWQDPKYQQLGRIIGECSSALLKPVSDLEDCISSLEQLIKAIDEYESVSF